MLKKTAGAGGGAVFTLVEQELDACQEANDKTGVNFWQNVWGYLTAVTSLPFMYPPRVEPCRGVSF
jgi:hypothetical protein